VQLGLGTFVRPRRSLRAPGRGNVSVGREVHRLVGEVVAQDAQVVPVVEDVVRSQSLPSPGKATDPG
jgi:hypothetical protein